MDSQKLAEIFEAHPVEAAPHLLGCVLSVTTARGTVAVRLTEVEAYGDVGEDPGSHAFRGQTARNATMFGPPRRAYIYRSYGIHFCLNLVAGAGVAGGILLRAGEVLSGRDLAVQRRGGRDTGAKLLSGPGRLGQGLGITLPMDGTPLEITRQDDDATFLPGPNTEVSFRLAPPESASLHSRSSIACPHPGQLSGASEIAPRAPYFARLSEVSEDTEPAPDSSRLSRVSSLAVSSGPRVGVSGVGGSAEYPWRFWISGDRSVSAYRPGKGVPPAPSRS
ncbi:DNA-3-methyladenine glycosylase [Nesterenkonia ebinurensis]|uniref:DNA-3-methyladenine glycosylase n=1 Tax=Nesterenkonia ebinurensis TaxID=2608252 RepID=UPI00123C82F4|nr:DNA-3-methyladenine glycosylase [Nesterenkonia ebinurensis]